MHLGIRCEVMTARIHDTLYAGADSDEETAMYIYNASARAISIQKLEK